MENKSIIEGQEKKKRRIEVCVGKSCEKTKIKVGRNNFVEPENFPNCSPRETIEKIEKAITNGEIKELK